MLVKETELKKYNRLYVSRIEELVFKPREGVTILLGKNGSGKSSLLKELLPNVTDSKDYDKDGSKRLTIEHNGNLYILGFRNGKHSFIKNNEELNVSGLKKTQQSLIELELGIDKDIHRLLLGELNFTDMPVAERKKWFTEILTTIDYKEALELYEKSKKKQNELKANIKLLRSKLIKLEKEFELLSEKDVNKLINLKNTLEKLNTNIVKLYHSSNPKQIDLPSIDFIKSILNTFLKLEKKYVGLPPDLVNNILVKLKSERNYLKEEIRKIDSKLSKLTTLLPEDSLREKEYIRERLEQLQELVDGNAFISFLKNNLRVNEDDINNLINNFKSYITDLKDVLFNIKTMDGYKLTDISKEKLDNVTNKIHKLDNGLTLLKDQLRTIVTEYNHLINLKDNEKIKCPKCGYEFVPGYDDKKLTVLKNEIKNLESKIPEIEKRKEKLINEHEILKNLFMLKSEFVTILRSIYGNYVKDVIEHYRTTTDGFSTNKLDSILNQLEEFILSLNNLDYKEVKKETAELNKRLELLDKLKTDKLQYLSKVKEELRTERVALIKKINSISDKAEYYNRELKYSRLFRDSLNTLENYLSNLEEVKKNIIIEEWNKLITKLSTYLKTLISEVSNKIVIINNYKINITELNNEINELEDKLKVNKKLTELLSPTKGIIAEYVTTTLNLIVESMNSILSEIWTYPIEIISVKIEDNGDFNYKFSAKLNDNKIIGDVSEGSSSIKEVINLAFRLTAMEFLDMTDYPLILDEFGRTMDPVHRDKAYNYIENVLVNEFKQIFLVSHFESMFGRFKLADIVTLTEDEVFKDIKNNPRILKIKRF